MQSESAQLRSTPYRWSELVSMVTRHRRELISANLIAILGAAVSVPIPLLIPLLVDEVLLNQPGSTVAVFQRLFPNEWHGAILYITAILILTISLRLASLILGVWQTRQFTIISKDLIFRMRRDLLLRLQRFSMSEYETLGSSIVAVLSILGTAIVLFWMHWQLALFIMLLNPIVIYLTTALGRRVKQLKKKENSAYQFFQESLGETLDAIQEIRAANREKHFVQRVIDAASNIRDHSANYTWKSDAASRFSFMVFLFGFDTFRALSMVMVLYSDLSIGQMLAVFASLWFMMTPVQEILGIQYAYHSARAALLRINQLMDVGLEPEYPTKTNPFIDHDTVSIETRRLTFSYLPDSPVLKDVNIQIKSGEKVAIVGASCGGKTTLVQLLLGLYTPQSGDVLFNGQSVKEISLEVVRDNVATVLQHPALFNDTIRANLTLGRDFTDEQLWHALEIAQLKETVTKLTDSLNTIVGRNGIRLSGGQRQRLAIARLVLSNPKVVILDEATSALDTDTEHQLHKALQGFLKGRTTLIVAHRLSAVKQADRALVFDNGQLVQDGSHQQLLKEDGLYASLYAEQETNLSTEIASA